VITKDQSAPPTPVDPRGFGCDDRADDLEVERRTAAMDRHDIGSADRHGDATADRHGIGTADWHDSGSDADPMPIGRRVVAGAEPHAEVVSIGSADADADADGGSPRRYPVIGSLAIWDEDIRLRDLLRIARKGDYNLSHFPIVRAANTAFFWVVTAPVVFAAFCFLYAFAVSLHRALTIAAILLIAAQAVPVIPWLVVSTWTASTWQHIGGFVVLLGVGTAIAAARERYR
jgi:hypothetical protein